MVSKFQIDLNMHEKVKSRDIFNKISLNFVVIILIFLFLFFSPEYLNTKISLSIPISNIKEFLIFLVIINYFYLNYKIKVSSKLNKIIILILILLSILKIYSYVNMPNLIKACYKFEINSSETNCLRSWDNVFINDFTRIENKVRFGAFGDDLFNLSNIQESNWNLSGLNSLDYNSFEKYKTDRLRPPLNVNWEFFNSNEENIVIIQRGLIKVFSDENLIYLNENYSNISSKQILLEDKKRIKIEYAFDPLKSDDYASITIENIDEEIFKLKQSTKIRFIEYINDIGRFFLIIILLYCQRFTIFKIFNKSFLNNITKSILIFFTILTILKYNNSSVSLLEFFNFSRSPYLSRGIFISIFFILLSFIFQIKKINDKLFFLIYLFTSYLIQIFPPYKLSKVFYKNSGEDFLTYESFSRDILNESSLRGGEDIFVYSPAIRYFNFLLHIIFGDSDLMIHFFYLFLLLLLSSQFLMNITKNVYLSDLHRIIIYFYILIFSFFISYRTIYYGASVLYSEYPTWLILITLFNSLINFHSIQKINLLLILSASLVLFRANHLLVSILLLIIILYLKLSKDQYYNKNTFVVKKICLFLITLSPIVIHNYFFGREIVFLQTSLPLPINFPLSPIEFIKNPFEPEVFEIFRSQVSGILARHSYIEYFKYPIFIIQFLYLTFIMLLIKKRENFLKLLMLLSIPIGFLLPHIFIQVFVYYPRHIVAGYLSMLLVIGILLKELLFIKDEKFSSEIYRD